MTKGALRAAAYAMAAVLNASALQAQASKEPAAPAAAELTALLKEFLAGASRSDAAVHERFWADDLIYTRGVGQRIGKADILRDMRSAPPSKADAPATAYSAEDIRIQQYGDTAVVAFRLVGTTTGSVEPAIANYLNTGTFVRRKGRWQAVAWQATRVPRPEAAAVKDLRAAQAAFHRALLAGDARALEGLLHESFVWTHRAGEQQTKREVVETIGSGQLEYSKMETSSVTVSVAGDSGIVRGTFFTMAFVDDGGAWKAVALHTSRP